MKHIRIVGILLLGTLILLLGLTVQQINQYAFPLDSASMIGKINDEKSYLMSPREVDAIAQSEQEAYQFIDLRSASDFAVAHLNGAMNIPLDRVLDKEWEGLWKSDQKKIVYDDDGMVSAEVWTLLTQLGYEDIYLLDGGLKGIEDKVVKTARVGKLYQSLNPTELKHLLDLKNITLLDVRTPDEVAEGALEGAVNLNLFDPAFFKEISKLPQDRHYVVYCRSGRRSVQACTLMARRGFKNVFNLEGGFIAWGEEE
jgi:rhodanese-related sulfurtransferase